MDIETLAAYIAVGTFLWKLSTPFLIDFIAKLVREVKKRMEQEVEDKKDPSVVV